MKKSSNEGQQGLPTPPLKTEWRTWPVVRLNEATSLIMVQPTNICSYLDKVQIWLSHELSSAELRKLRALCRGNVHKRRKRPRFGRVARPKYREFLVLRQPTLEALAVISSHEGSSLVNGLEIALDWDFDDGETKQFAADAVSFLHVKKRHQNESVRIVGATRYSDARGAPNIFVIYDDRKNRVSGNQDCVHLEWRINGVQALRRNGITSINSLVAFDARAFWSRRLTLFDLNRRKLGRAYHNWRLATRRRGRWVSRHGPLTYDHDLRIGSTIVGALGTVQAVVDLCGRRFPVKTALIPIECSHLLPHPRLS